jgi:hypothetical protein
MVATSSFSEEESEFLLSIGFKLKPNGGYEHSSLSTLSTDDGEAQSSEVYATLTEDNEKAFVWTTSWVKTITPTDEITPTSLNEQITKQITTRTHSFIVHNSDSRLDSMRLFMLCQP